jgi:DNA invertase Pin-like site-specific DNA recombinase
LQRPHLAQLLDYVREGDTVVCHSMDRLGRNLDDLRKVVLGLTERGIHVRFVRENLTFTGADSPMANLLLSVMGAFAHYAKFGIMRSHSLEVALRPGTYAGRKRSLSAAQAADLRRRFAAGESRTALARKLGISRQTLYRYLE